MVISRQSMERQMKNGKKAKKMKCGGKVKKYMKGGKVTKKKATKRGKK